MVPRAGILFEPKAFLRVNLPSSSAFPTELSGIAHGASAANKKKDAPSEQAPAPEVKR